MIDTSEHNGTMDWYKAVSAGAKAAYTRVCWLYEDKRFKEFWPNMTAAGMPKGGYNYLDWRGSTKDQAYLFCSLMGNDIGQLRPMLDLEMDATAYLDRMNIPIRHNAGIAVPDMMPETRKVIGSGVRPLQYRASLDMDLGMSRTEVQGKVWEWLQIVEQETGKVPIIYTGYFYWTYWMTADPAWKKYDFFLAWYAAESVIKVPPPWTNWRLWQYMAKGPGPTYGSQGLEMDMDWFNGTEADLKAYIGGDPVTTAHDLSIHPPHYCAICGAKLTDIDDNPTPPLPPAAVAYVVLAGHYPNVRKEALSTSPLVQPSPMQAGYKLFVDKHQPIDATHAYAYSHFIPDTLYTNGGWVLTDTIGRV